MEFLYPSESDHCPAIIKMCQDFHLPPKPFKFFNFWTKHPDFLKVVESSWKEQVHGNPMSTLHQKMKKLKASLRSFNKFKYADISGKVKEKRRELAEVQLQNLSTPTPGLVELEKILNLELHELLLAEESFFKQKSRIKWIQKGDMNTQFFHRMTAARQKQMTISTLIDSQGRKLTTYSQITNEAVSYFQQLLGTVDINVIVCPKMLLAELLSGISEGSQSDLIRPISADEIKATMFSINGDKAPGPDGFSSHFFKNSWSIVGEDVCKAVLFFF